MMHLNADYSQPSVSDTFQANNLPSAVHLTRSTKSLNVNYSIYAIELLYSGMYEVKYSILLKVPSALPTNVVNVSVAISDDTFAPEPISQITIPIQDSSYHLFAYSVLRSVGNGEVSKLGNKFLSIMANQSVDYTYTAAYLSVNRFGDIP